MILPVRAKLAVLAAVAGLAAAGVLVLLPGLERTFTQAEQSAHGHGGLAGAFIQGAVGRQRRAGRRAAHASHARPRHGVGVDSRPRGIARRRPARPTGARQAAGAGGVWWLLLTVLLAVPAVGIASAMSRLRSRLKRVYWRYRIFPNAHDRPSAEQVVRALGTIGATVSEPASTRAWSGQPVFGVQLDYDPQDGGRLTPWLVCERRHAHALDGALQQAYRNVRIELDEGKPLPESAAWRPGSVLRLRKSRDPIYPLYGSPQAAGLGPPLNSAGVMLHNLCKPLADRPGTRGSVRVMVLPADRTAAYLRERHRRVEKRSQLAGQLERGGWAAQSSVDAQQSRQSAQMAEHAMFHVEVQLAAENFATCKSLAGALLDYPGLNTLKRRQVQWRAGLYCRRWASFAPPLVMHGSRKLFSAAELAYVVRLPSAALSVPFATAREPRLPANGGVRGQEPGPSVALAPNAVGGGPDASDRDRSSAAPTGGNGRRAPRSAPGGVAVLEPAAK
jgi:hypothetical protein